MSTPASASFTQSFISIVLGSSSGWNPGTFSKCSLSQTNMPDVGGTKLNKALEPYARFSNIRLEPVLGLADAVYTVQPFHEDVVPTDTCMWNSSRSASRRKSRRDLYWTAKPVDRCALITGTEQHSNLHIP